MFMLLQAQSPIALSGLSRYLGYLIEIYDEGPINVIGGDQVEIDERFINSSYFSDFEYEFFEIGLQCC